MKLSTRKVIGVNIAVLALMLILAVLPLAEVLRNYLQVAVLMGAIGASLILFGWARPRGRESKLTSILILLAAVVFQVIIFVLLGYNLGFVRNVYGVNLKSIMMVFLPFVLLIVGEEILRGQLVEKGKNSPLAVIVTGVTLWLVEICMALPLYDLVEARGWFDVATVVMMPGLLGNALLTYIAYYFDYRINIGYRLIMSLPGLILPVWPDANEYLLVLFETIVVFALLVGLISMQKFGGVIQIKLQAIRQSKKIETASAQRRKRLAGRTVVAILVIIMLAYAGLMSGLFKYHFLAIGSGSMEPNLYRGDMILVEKSDNYDDMEVGEILVYRHSDVIMVHRITDRQEDGNKWTFTTKGDANSSDDNWVVGQGDVIGTAKGKITMFGYPTLWLNELFNGGKI